MQKYVNYIWYINKIVLSLLCENNVTMLNNNTDMKLFNFFFSDLTNAEETALVGLFQVALLILIALILMTFDCQPAAFVIGSCGCLLTVLFDLIGFILEGADF